MEPTSPSSSAKSGAATGRPSSRSPTPSSRSRPPTRTRPSSRPANLGFLDTYHFNAPSQVTLGQRLAASYIADFRDRKTLSAGGYHVVRVEAGLVKGLGDGTYGTARRESSRRTRHRSRAQRNHGCCGGRVQHTCLEIRRHSLVPRRNDLATDHSARHAKPGLDACAGCWTERDRRHRRWAPSFPRARYRYGQSLCVGTQRQWTGWKRRAVGCHHPGCCSNRCCVDVRG